MSQLKKGLVVLLSLSVNFPVFSEELEECTNQYLRFLNNYFYYADRIHESDTNIKKALEAWDLEQLTAIYYEAFPDASLGTVIKAVTLNVLSREYDSKTRTMTSYAARELKNGVVELVVDVENRNDGDQAFDVLVSYIDLEKMKFVGVHHTDEFPPGLERIQCKISLGSEML